MYCYIRITASYEHAGDRRPCCISDGYFHQYCDCNGALSDCKFKCDEDKNCKGYVAWTFGKPEGGCIIATSSLDCPYKCSFSLLGNVRPLVVNGTCGQDRDDWGGCYIKIKEGRCTVIAKCYCFQFYGKRLRCIQF